MKAVAGVADTRLSRDPGGPEELIVIDRQKAADMHLTVSRIANALQTILSGTEAGYYRQGGDEFAILVKLRDAEKSDLRDILDLTLTNTDGEPVVLRNVVDVAPRSGPVLIERKDQERIITVTGEISGRDMGSVIADVQDGLRSVPVPSGFTIGFGGDYEEQQKSFRELLFSCVLALVLVYMVMACQYESLRDPFVVMFSVPLAAIGVILMLFFTGTTFNIQSFIGCIMLGGIVVNNAILLVDHTNLLRRRDGMPIREAHRRGRTPASAADPHDGLDDDPRPGAAGAGPGRRRRGAGPHGPRGHRRPGQLHADHARLRARRLLALRASRLACGGPRPGAVRKPFPMRNL